MFGYVRLGYQDIAHRSAHPNVLSNRTCPLWVRLVWLDYVMFVYVRFGASDNPAITSLFDQSVFKLGLVNSR
jgi:hypothetical protein